MKHSCFCAKQWRLLANTLQGLDAGTVFVAVMMLLSITMFYYHALLLCLSWMNFAITLVQKKKSVSFFFLH